MSRITKVIAEGIAPLSIILGLLYVGLFVKPAAVGQPVEPPLIGPRDVFFSVAAAADGQLWAVGAGGKIVAAADGGEGGGLRLQPAGTTANLQAVAAWDARRALAVGNDGVVLRTGDGGAHWARVSAPVSQVADKLVGVAVRGEGEAYAVGEYNRLMRSRDGGASWTQLLPERDAALYAVALGERGGIAVGEFGRVLHSEDGEDWREAEAVTDRHLTAVALAPDGRALAVGLDGTVIASADGGRRWQALPAPAEVHLYAVVFDGERFVAAGTRGTVLASADGAAWQPVETGMGGAERNFAWFTAIRPWRGGYLLSGSRLAHLKAGRLADLQAAPRG